MIKSNKILTGAFIGVDLALLAAIISTGQTYLIPMIAKLSMMQQIKLFTMFSGGALVGGETLAYYLKLKTQKAKDKLANGHLIEKDDILDILGDDGIKLSKELQLKEKYDFEGTVIFAPTGAGKTTAYFMPNLLSNDIRGSLIILDPKGDIFKKTSKYQETVCKRRVLKFSPLEPTESERYNLLTSCKSNEDVKELATTLLFNGALSIELSCGRKVGGAEWIQMSESLLCSALLYAKDLDFPFNNIEFAFKLLITLDTEQLDILFSSSNNIDVKCQWNIFKSVGKADKTEGSIKITMASNIKLFTDSRINAIGNESTFNIDDFRKQENILYITYPENKSAYLAPYTAPFFSQIIDRLINIYQEGVSLPVTIFFEEFGNIGMLNNMSINAATCRSREISLNVCLQSITQLYQVYGRDNAKAILNNLKTKIVLAGLSDIDTLNYISGLCGDKEITVCNTSVTKNNISQNYSKTKVKLFENSELRCLNDDEMLIITSNKQPIISKQNRYFENEEYTQNIFDNTASIPKNDNIYNQKDIEKKILDLKLQSIKENEGGNDVKKEISRMFGR
jgi:type IV secretion system protein VirD4